MHMHMRMYMHMRGVCIGMHMYGVRYVFNISLYHIQFVYRYLAGLGPSGADGSQRDYSRTPAQSTAQSTAHAHAHGASPPSSPLSASTWASSSASVKAQRGGTGAGRPLPDGNETPDAINKKKPNRSRDRQRAVHPQATPSSPFFSSSSSSSSSSPAAAHAAPKFSVVRETDRPIHIDGYKCIVQKR